VCAACNRDRMEPDGISDIEGKVARVATSKLGNERVSNSTSAHSTQVFINVWLSQRVRPSWEDDIVEVDDIISYHDLVTEEKAALDIVQHLARSPSQTAGEAIPSVAYFSKMANAFIPGSDFIVPTTRRPCLKPRLTRLYAKVPVAYSPRPCTCMCRKGMCGPNGMR
jgi:hypothetical protein